MVVGGEWRWEENGSEREGRRLEMVLIGYNVAMLFSQLPVS
jgi:hypothetical protein